MNFYNQLPSHVISILDNMIYFFCQRDDVDISVTDMKKRVISNLENLEPKDKDFLVNQLTSLAQEVNTKDQYEEPKDVKKELISVLIKVFY